MPKGLSTPDSLSFLVESTERLIHSGRSVESEKSVVHFHSATTACDAGDPLGLT